MDFNAIQQEVLKKASTEEGKEKIKKRNEAMLALKERLQKWTSTKDQRAGVIRRRDGIMFAASQTKVKGNDLILGVEHDGRGIGELRINSGGVARFRVSDETRSSLKDKDLQVSTSKELFWSHHPADGDVIRAFLKAVTGDSKNGGRPQERAIQWQLFHELKRQGSGKPGEGFCPVLWADFPSEIPTWMNLKGDTASNAGNIDMLVRGKSPNPRNLPPIYAFEVKRPSNGAGSKSLLEDAAKQGFQYALALSIEANGFVVEDTSGFSIKPAENFRELRAAYRWLFGVRGRGYSDEESLQFGVVAVLAKRDVEEGVLQDLRDAWKNYKQDWVDRFGVLTYEDDEEYQTYDWVFRSWE